MNKTLTLSFSTAVIIASFLVGNEAVLAKKAQAGISNTLLKHNSVQTGLRPNVTCMALLPQCGYKPTNQKIRPERVRYPRPTHTTHPGHDIPGGPVFCITSPCPNQIPQPTHGYGGGVIPIYHHNTAF